MLFICKTLNLAANGNSQQKRTVSSGWDIYEYFFSTCWEGGNLWVLLGRSRSAAAKLLHGFYGGSVPSVSPSPYTCHHNVPRRPPSFPGHSTNFLPNQHRAVPVGEALKQTHTMPMPSISGRFFIENALFSPQQSQGRIYSQITLLSLSWDRKSALSHCYQQNTRSSAAFRVKIFPVQISFYVHNTPPRWRALLQRKAVITPSPIAKIRYGKQHPSVQMRCPELFHLCLQLSQTKEQMENNLLVASCSPSASSSLEVEGTQREKGKQEVRADSALPTRGPGGAVPSHTWAMPSTQRAQRCG